MVMRVPDKLAGLSIPEYRRQMGYTEGSERSARVDDSFVRFAAAGGEAELRAVGNLAGAVGEATEEGLKLYEHYQTARATEAYTAFQKAMNEKMYGANGIFTRQGEAAFNSKEDMEDAMRDTVTEIAEKNGLGPDARMKLARNVFGFGRQVLPKAEIRL